MMPRIPCGTGASGLPEMVPNMKLVERAPDFQEATALASAALLLGAAQRRRVAQLRLAAAGVGLLRLLAHDALVGDVLFRVDGALVGLLVHGNSP